MSQISNIRRAEKIVQIPSLIHAFPCGTGDPIDDDGIEYYDIPEMFLSGIKEPYIIEARGDSMTPKINHGDRLIIDHIAEPRVNDAVVAFLNGDYLIKYYKIKDGRPLLVPSNVKYDIIEINETDDFHILGVVKWVVSTPSLDRWD